MAKRTTKKKVKKKPIESYDHKDKKRPNNPPVGLVTPDTDPDKGKKQTYQYDPHLDPQLVWAGKAEHTSFEVPTVSLHVHERIDPRTIVEAVRKRNRHPVMQQLSLFEAPEENPPLREAIEFYKHAHNWTNRLIAGDSLLVMNSLLEKEGMAGKVQMIYIDPPYGIRYGSNFQPFVNKRDVKDGKDEDLTQEPEMIRAFRDTWELGIHSYLSYLRDRLLLARELLHESGSCFVQISDENLHLVRGLLDEVFGVQNFYSVITFQKTGGLARSALPTIGDFIVWYCKDQERAKLRPLFLPKELGDVSGDITPWFAEEPDRTHRPLTNDEKKNPSTVPPGCHIFRPGPLKSEGSGRTSFDYPFEGDTFPVGANKHWKVSREGLDQVVTSGRMFKYGKTIHWKYYTDDYPVRPLTNIWIDTQQGGFSDIRRYVVQTATKAVTRCLLMTTDPDDLVLDPTCGSGTTAHVAEQWGRRWITCDTSRVAVALTKQRVITQPFAYYELAHADEGVGSGFNYRTAPHITLGSIANNPEIKEGMSREQIDAAIAKYADQETLYDQPFVDNKKARVSGPFTVEAVPAPAVRSIAEVGRVGTAHQEDTAETGVVGDAHPTADSSVGRPGETLRQDEWRGELLKCGIRGKSGQRVEFSRVEALPGTRWLHADAETKDDTRERVVVSFGPEHAPLEQRQVEQALEEAQLLKPKPKMVVFASFQFDPEAAKDIDETNWPGITLLKVQMNTDLLTDDLKKKRSSNESFWMIGQPDVVVVSEEWLVDSGGRMVAAYELYQKLSGFDRLAEINELDQDDLRFYAAVSQGGALRAYLADASGGGVGSGEHCGGAGEAIDGGVSPVSGNRARVTGRIGDAHRLVEQLGLRDAGKRRAFVKRLRGDKQIAERASQITIHAPLTTRHYSQVTILGFDYYNPVDGKIESGDTSKIAMWMLDTDYDGRSLYPRQVFFPMAGAKDGWARLAKNRKAEIDEELIEAYRGTVSLPFEPGDHKRVAVKIIDDRGIESLKIVEMG